MAADEKRTSNGKLVLPETPPPGTGRLGLTDICNTYGLDPQALLTALKTKNIADHEGIGEFIFRRKTLKGAVLPCLSIDRNQKGQGQGLVHEVFIQTDHPMTYSFPSFFRNPC